MSFEIFIQFHLNGGSLKVPTSQVKDAFQKHLQEGDNHSWLEYDENESCDIFGLSDRDFCDSFMVSRPVANIAFWEELHHVLSLEGAVLLAPGLKGVIIGNSATRTHLPKDMVDALKSVMLVQSGPEIDNLLP